MARGRTGRRRASRASRACPQPAAAVPFLVASRVSPAPLCRSWITSWTSEPRSAPPPRRAARGTGASAARGERPEGDVDVLVDLEPGRTLFDLAASEERLERLVGRPVQVTTAHALREPGRRARRGARGVSAGGARQTTGPRRRSRRPPGARSSAWSICVRRQTLSPGTWSAGARRSTRTPPSRTRCCTRLYELVVPGQAAEAALQADPSLVARYPAVPWSSMASVRDRAADHYYKLDRDVLWERRGRRFRRPRRQSGPPCVPSRGGTG